MSIATPHFLLFSESRRGPEHSRWRFVLEALDGTDKLEASDIESDIHGERLELLAVVRGLEALPQPSRVTLVTPSRYVDRGLTDGLPEWRNNNWQWEHFGEMAPIKNRDLWQRVDRALEYHQIDCRLRRADEPAQHQVEPQHPAAGPNYRYPSRAKSPGSQHQAVASSTGSRAVTQRASTPELSTQSKVNLVKEGSNQTKLPCLRRPKRIRLARRIGELLASLKVRLAQFGTGLLPPPWFN